VEAATGLAGSEAKADAQQRKEAKQRKNIARISSGKAHYTARLDYRQPRKVSTAGGLDEIIAINWMLKDSYRKEVSETTDYFFSRLVWLATQSHLPS